MTIFNGDRQTGEAYGLDWQYLRGALVFFICAVALSASLLAGSMYFERRMEQGYLRHSDKLDSLSRRYHALAGQEDVIRDFSSRFMDLYKNGILGREHRLNWIEVLQEAGNRLSVPSLSYEIRAQTSHYPEFAAPAGGYGIFVSEMSLEMQLLHEGDLFTLLRFLNEHARGLYSVSSCELTRNFVQLTDDPGAGNVTASCLLEWFSIKPKDDMEIKV